MMISKLMQLLKSKTWVRNVKLSHNLAPYFLLYLFSQAEIFPDYTTRLTALA